MKELLRKIFRKDLWQHFLLGYVISMVVTTFTLPFFFASMSIVVVAVIAVICEVFDSQTGHHASIPDVAATILGGIIGTLVMIQIWLW